MKVEIKKEGKGHNIFIDGKLITWVIGSKKNANKELELCLLYLKTKTNEEN